MEKGIDISRHQGKYIDFAKVKKSGIEFVIIRAGYGKLSSQVDSCFNTNHMKAKAAGIPVGAYWYSYATSVSEAEAEADVCLQAIKGKQFEYPIFYDVEEQKTFKTGKTNEIIKAFCSKLEKAGYFAGVYISRSPAQTYLSIDTRNRYTMWLAEYSSKLNYNGDYGMWQYSSTGKVDGINGCVDMDYCYEDYPTIIKSKGLNGYSNKKTPSTATATATKMATSTKPTTKYYKGDAVTLKNTPLFVNEIVKLPSNVISGKYYLYDGKEYKQGRYKITPRKEYCGKGVQYVTGYVSYDNFNKK